MEDHSFCVSSTQVFKLISSNIEITTRLSATFIFIHVLWNHVPVQGRIWDKEDQKANKQKDNMSVAANLLHRNVTLEICAGFWAQAVCECLS